MFTLLCVSKCGIYWGAGGGGGGVLIEQIRYRNNYSFSFLHDLACTQPFRLKLNLQRNNYIFKFFLFLKEFLFTILPRSFLKNSKI